MYNNRDRRNRQDYMYNYSQPSMPQYQSFFNPIPLEFVQDILQRKQEGYNTSYASALAAKDMYSGVEVGAEDIADKNQIVNDFTNNMDNIVKEKYGGDWGRAAKEIARMVTSVRQNSFWDTAKILKDRREQERQLIMRYGSKALPFKSLQGVSAIDPTTGQVRRPEELEFDVQEQGDWQGYMKTILSSINPDQYAFGLSDEEKGFLSHGEFSRIDRKKLDKIINQPEVINAFLNSNPEFEKAVKAGLRYSEYNGNVKEAAKDFFRGNLYPTEFYKENKNFVQDWMLKEKMNNANGNPYIGSTSELPVVSNMQTALKKHQRLVKGFTFVDRVGQGEGTLTEEKEKELALIHEQYNKPKYINPETGINSTLQTAVRDFQNGLTKKDFYKPLDYYNDLVKEYPELGELNQEEAFKIYENYLTSLEKESRVVSNLVLKNSSENVKGLLYSNINAGDLQTSAFRSTGDVFDRNSIVTKLGYKSYDEFKTKMDKEENIFPRADFREGKLVISVFTKKGDPVDVYFNPDIETREILNVGQAINERYYDPKTYGDESKPIPIPNAGGLAFIVVGEGNIVNGNKKEIHLVNIYSNDKPEKMTIQQANYYLAGIMDKRLNDLKEIK